MTNTQSWLAFLVFIVSGYDAVSQCCTSGNPFISDAEQPALQSRVLTASLTYRYSHSGPYYAKDSHFSDLPVNEVASANYMELQLGYGITNWLTVMTELGYFINKTLVTTGVDSYRGYGFGDAALYLKFNAYSNPKKRFSISPTIGVKFPVGVFDQEVDNVQLPISVQPSSGAFKYLANIFASKGFGKIAIAGFFSYEYSQLIHSDNFYYKYGDQWIGAVYFNYRPLKRLILDFQLRNEYRSKSSRENAEIVDASGYDVVYFTPQVTYAFKHDWYLSTFADIPLYKYYNGFQLTFGYAVALRLTKKLDFLAIGARAKAGKSKLCQESK